MASSTYYDSHPLLVEQQQQHLLSPALSSPGFHSETSSGPSTPLKPLNMASVMNSPSKHSHRQSLVDFEGLKKAHEQDAVRDIPVEVGQTQSVDNVLDPQSANPPSTSRITRPRLPHFCRCLRPHHYDFAQIHHNSRCLSGG